MYVCAFAWRADKWLAADDDVERERVESLLNREYSEPPMWPMPAASSAAVAPTLWR